MIVITGMYYQWELWAAGTSPQKLPELSTGGCNLRVDWFYLPTPQSAFEPGPTVSQRPQTVSFNPHEKAKRPSTQLRGTPWMDDEFEHTEQSHS